MADLDRIRALLDATTGHTPGPWLVGHSVHGRPGADWNIYTADGSDITAPTGSGLCAKDAALAAAAPDLRAAIAEAVEEIATLRAALAGWPIAMAEAVRAAVAEVARLRAENAELWGAVNDFLHEEPCPVCEDGPEPVRRWLHDGDRVACVCGHGGRVVGGEDSPAYLEWDEVAEVRG